MALNALQLCSRALVKIGENPISCFDDGTSESEVSNALYGFTRDALLPPIHGVLPPPKEPSPSWKHRPSPIMTVRTNCQTACCGYYQRAQIAGNKALCTAFMARLCIPTPMARLP